MKRATAEKRSVVRGAFELASTAEARETIGRRTCVSTPPSLRVVTTCSTVRGLRNEEPSSRDVTAATWQVRKGPSLIGGGLTGT